MIKIAHFSDIHVGAPSGHVPEWRRYLGKRLLGTVNLKFFGRGSHFKSSLERLPLLLRDIAAEQPDYVFCSGDFSAMSFLCEFQEVRNVLQKEFSSLHDVFLFVPGNHDRYTLGEIVRGNFFKVFNAFHQPDHVSSSGQAYPSLRFLKEGKAVIMIDVSRYHIVARGLIATRMLQEIENLLKIARQSRAITFLLLHYPAVRADGSPLKLTHRCVHIESLVALAESYDVAAWFCGHVHHNYRIKVPGTSIWLLNSGSATYRERGYYNLYEIDERKMKVIPKKYDEEKKQFVVQESTFISLRREKTDEIISC